MKVVMIILMFGGADGGRAVRTVDFASDSLCQAARTELLNHRAEFSMWKPVIVCAKTGY